MSWCSVVGRGRGRGRREKGEGRGERERGEGRGRRERGEVERDVKHIAVSMGYLFVAE